MPSKDPSPPKHWPRNMLYLSNTTCHYSPRLSSTQRLALHDPSKLELCHKPDPVVASTPTLVHISPISNPSHPAHGQHGLFATRHLAPDRFIVYYLGFVHGPDDTDETSDYDLSLDREAEISVDASRMGNEARFINDYRGSRAEGPNAEFRDCVVRGEKGRWERRIGVFVMGPGKGRSGNLRRERGRGIRKGEEVLVSYGKGFWRGRAEVEGGDGDGPRKSDKQFL